MAENMVIEATKSLTKSFNDTSKVFADSTVAAQERNWRYGQSVVENGLEVLKSHTEGTRSLTQALLEQSQKQQEIFQSLTREAVEAYLGFFSNSFSYYRQAFESAELLTSQGVDVAQKVVREGVEVAQAAMRQGQKVIQ